MPTEKKTVFDWWCKRSGRDVVWMRSYEFMIAIWMSFLTGLDCVCIRSDSSENFDVRWSDSGWSLQWGLSQVEKKNGCGKLKFSLTLGGGGRILEVTHDHRSQRAKKFLKKAASEINQTFFACVLQLIEIWWNWLLFHKKKTVKALPSVVDLKQQTKGLPSSACVSLLPLNFFFLRTLYITHPPGHKPLENKPSLLNVSLTMSFRIQVVNDKTLFRTNVAYATHDWHGTIDEIRMFVDVRWKSW